MLPEGALRETIKRRSALARQSGALEAIDTISEFITDSGIEFLVRIATSLGRKDRATRRAGLKDARSDVPTNPFMNPDPELLVADVTDTHRCLLNKFNVVDEHLLIVTKAFEQQENPLDINDFVALWTCMREYEALAFYNSRPKAGASQSHKHLQMVPLPLSPHGEGIPVEAVLRPASTAGSVDRCNALPFMNRWMPFREPSDNVELMASESLRIYTRLLEAVGCEPQNPGAYNLLATRRWMMIVPRSRECFESISLNALAFAGSFFVRSRRQLEMLKRRGPMTALRHVGLHDDWRD